jgi:CDP-glucose 4,6-dehydratase
MTTRDTWWQDRPVAVTGAMGFLGSHVTELLVGSGAQVVALVRDDVPPTPIVERWRGRVTEVRGEVQDQALLERIFGEYECATVLHLAAQTQVGVANRNAPSTFDSNVRGTWALLEACRRSPTVEQIVVASSDKAYGEQPALPYTEEMPLLAVHPYDVSKACADLISLSYAATFGLPVSVSRCGNFFGPGDTNWNRIVPGTIRSLLRGRRPVVRSDGTPTRDYIHVVDGALAYLQLAKSMSSDPRIAGQPFNFSPESPMNVVDLVELISDAVGRTDLEPDIQATAKNEIQDQYLSSAKAREMLGWEPALTMQEALADTVAWYRDFLAQGEPQRAS